MDVITLNRKHVLNMYRDKQYLDAELNKPFGIQKDYDAIYTILHRNKNLFKQLGIPTQHGWRLFNNADSYINSPPTFELTLLREDYRRNWNET